MRICHYDDVQIHVCNSASVCTSVSQHERMHAHALCVSCKEITLIAIVAEWPRQGIIARTLANWRALYTTINREVCECVANSLTRPVLNTAMGGATLLQPLKFPGSIR